MGLVAVEQIKFPENKRILDDHLAYKILPFSMRSAVWLKAGPFTGDFIVRQAEKKVPGLWASILCRKRYINDRVSEAVRNGQVDAVVNLGAGYDTRAYSLPSMANVPVFELDQPGMIASKRSRLMKILGEVPAHVTLVPIDFDSEDPGTVLASHGYRTSQRTLFILEGVTQYLTRTGVRSTFDFLGGAAAESRLIFTYVRGDFIIGRVPDGYEFLYRKMVLKDNIWLFGLEPGKVADFLGGYGWSVIEHIGYDELAEQYVRPTGRSLLSMPVERLVYARKI